MALPFETLYVEGGAVADDLRRALAHGSRARIVAKAGDAEALLQITGEGREKRILSLSGAGRVREYLLVYRVTSRSTANGCCRNGQLRRDMTFDDAFVLAKAEEEEKLYRDMQTDAVAQIARRLNAVRLPPPPEAED
jgi:LPS-assembly lipoprotein